MPIDNLQQNRLIARHSDRVVHWRSNICSCSETGKLEDSNINCLKCNGLGVFWSDPKVINAIIVGLDSDRTGRHWLQNGIALPEDMTCSAYAADARRFKDFDKIVPTWRVGFPYAGDLLQRGSRDRLMYKPVGRMQKVSRTNPETGVVTTWTQGIDYNVAGPESREIEWVPGHGPSLDTIYAAVYEPRYEFVSWSPPAPRWERGRDLGRRVLLRKLHLPWPTTNWA